MDWAEFERAAPDLAAQVGAAFGRFGFGLAGTIRRDGTPRVSPVEIHFVRGRLMLAVIAETRKARDLARDPRILIRTPVTDAATPESESTLRGRVRPAADPAQRAATAAAIETRSGWRPQESWRFFAVDLEAVSHVEWHGDEMRLTRWDTTRGLRPAERRRLDMAVSGYVRVPD
ncbi:pyridoxamine 5'-phosphate oxidase family protein [Nocardia sp. NPDC127526]|uniref:pyridoxamine 5'-phosphate oxidase family protein n=1 Tax=Nocardia sp. NPDC127526 TaxID=3345393 RepID=UPI003638BA85